MNLSRKTFIKLAIAGGGALIFTSCRKAEATGELPPGVDYYTCVMHSFVHASAPGKCPVCGMDLVPVMKKGAGIAAMAAGSFTIPEDRQQQIGVTYAAVERRRLRKTLRAAGAVENDRQRSWVFAARTDGYVKKLFVTSPGEIVERNQPLLSFYSPDLFTAEREYVMLYAMGGDPALLDSARERLKLWNITDDEIAAIEKSRKPAEEVTLYSPFRGVVKDVAPEQGGNVKTGDKLVEVADLSRVWVWADFYEAELGSLHEGQQATVKVSSYPGEVFGGKVTLINPFLDEGQRTFRVRIDIDNEDIKLRPGMYADVSLEIDAGEGLVIPLNAVMPTGRRNLVFVDKGGGKLEPREVTLGGEYDGYYEVKEGLADGERIVTSATFLIDAEAQIQGALKGFDSEAKP